MEVPHLREVNEGEASRVCAHVARVMPEAADGVGCARRDAKRAQMGVAKLEELLVSALSSVAALRAEQREHAESSRA